MMTNLVEGKGTFSCGDVIILQLDALIAQGRKAPLKVRRRRQNVELYNRMNYN
jgi:hypothetical protein